MTVLPLGITGAYVTEAQNRVELLVIHVLDDAPATGVLQVDDIIIGANGRLFEDTEDPRPEMGHALVESQSPELGGILTLRIVRDRKPLRACPETTSQFFGRIITRSAMATMKRTTLFPDKA